MSIDEYNQLKELAAQRRDQAKAEAEHMMLQAELDFKSRIEALDLVWELEHGYPAEFDGQQEPRNGQAVNKNGMIYFANPR